MTTNTKTVGGGAAHAEKHLGALLGGIDHAATDLDSASALIDALALNISEVGMNEQSTIKVLAGIGRLVEAIRDELRTLPAAVAMGGADHGQA